MKQTNEELLTMYRQLLLGRKFDLTIAEKLQTGKLPGFWHLGVGEEAVDVGVLNALGPNDWISPSHRGHTMLIVKLGLKPAMAEFLAKDNAVHHGMCGPFHLVVPEKKLLPGSGILGGTVGMAAGAALTFKMNKLPDVAVVMIGDGGCGEGVVFECMNMAAAYNLPIVFVIRNNSFSISYRTSQNLKTKDLMVRAQGVGMTGVKADGNDVLQVMEAVETAIEKARKGEPNVVELKTFRIRAHSEGGATHVNSSPEENEAARKNDPIEKFGKVLSEKNILNDAKKMKIEAEVNQEIQEAFDEVGAYEPTKLERILDPNSAFAL